MIWLQIMITLFTKKNNNDNIDLDYGNEVYY